MAGEGRARRAGGQGQVRFAHNGNDPEQPPPLSRINHTQCGKPVPTPVYIKTPGWAGRRTTAMYEQQERRKRKRKGASKQQDVRGGGPAAAVVPIPIR